MGFIKCVKCPNCGKEISKESFSCVYCGFKLTGDEKIIIEEESKHSNSMPNNISKTYSSSNINFNNIGIASIICGLIFWIKAFIKAFNDYESDLIIAMYFIGLAIMGGTLIFSGFFIIIYEKIKDNQVKK